MGLGPGGAGSSGGEGNDGGAGIGGMGIGIGGEMGYGGYGEGTNYGGAYDSWGGGGYASGRGGSVSESFGAPGTGTGGDFSPGLMGYIKSVYDKAKQNYSNIPSVVKAVSGLMMPTAISTPAMLAAATVPAIRETFFGKPASPHADAPQTTESLADYGDSMQMQGLMRNATLPRISGNLNTSAKLGIIDDLGIRDIINADQPYVQAVNYLKDRGLM